MCYFILLTASQLCFSICPTKDAENKKILEDNKAKAKAKEAKAAEQTKSPKDQEDKCDGPDQDGAQDKACHRKLHCRRHCHR